MNYADIHSARNEAQEQIGLADRAVRGAVQLAAGRLRVADCYVDDLRKLKAELQDFNATSGKWKEKK